MTDFDELWNMEPQPIQVYDELKYFYPYVLNLKPKNVLEIGACWGGTLRFWMKAAQDDGKIIVVENFSWPEDLRKRKGEVIPRWRSWLKPSQTLHVIEGNSEDAGTIQKVKDILGGEKLDFLFIDGNHNQARLDYDNYNPFVRDGGIIAFHDIAGPPLLMCEPARKDWLDIREKLLTYGYPSTVEIVCRGKTTGISGIGFVVLEGRRK